MKIRLTVLGFELWCLEFDLRPSLDTALQRVADEIEVEDEEEPKVKQIAGGSHDGSERDLNPLYPETQKDYDSWMDRPVGRARQQGFGFVPRPKR